MQKPKPRTMASNKFERAQNFKRNRTYSKNFYDSEASRAHVIIKKIEIYKF